MAHLAHGGAFWAVKGQPGVLDDVFVTASLHDELVSHHRFGAPDRRSAFTPGRVAIEHRQRITMTRFGDGSSLEFDSGFDRVRVTGPGGDV